MTQAERFDEVAREARACRVCEPFLADGVRPVFQGSASSRVRIIGQAPGVRVHKSGVPFTDPSGDRLRGWMGVDEAAFYDPRLIAITPMGLCFPGLDAEGSDKPPRKECAPLWQDRFAAALPQVELTLLVGGYAQKHVLGPDAGPTLSETVLRWRDHLARGYFALPHPSWRNNAWIKKHPWFEVDVLPALKERMCSIINSTSVEDKNSSMS